MQIPHALRRQRAAVELICPVARIDAHPSGHQHAQAVFRAETQLLRARTEHDAAQRTFVVLEREIMMSGWVDLIVGKLAAHTEPGEQSVSVQQKPDVLVELRDG